MFARLLAELPMPADDIQVFTIFWNLSQFSEIFHNFLFRRGRQGQRCPTPLAQSAWLSFPSRSRWGLGSCFESPEKCFAGDPPRLPWWHPSCLPPSLHLPVALRVIFALLHFFLIKNNIYIFFNFLNSQALHLPCLQKHIDLEWRWIQDFSRRGNADVN